VTGLGVGRDIWTINPDDLTAILRWFYIDEILYLAILPIIKTSICLTLLRIFPADKFRLMVFFALGLNAAYGVTFVLITVFQCSPVNYVRGLPNRGDGLGISWTDLIVVGLASLGWHASRQVQRHQCSVVGFSSPEHPARCLVGAHINCSGRMVIVDADNICAYSILILPMPWLWQLNLNIRKKIAVMLMFGVGSFVLLVSIVRLHLLVKFGESQNFTSKSANPWPIDESLLTSFCR
jgi:hypothetical protein